MDILSLFATIKVQANVHLTGEKKMTEPATKKFFAILQTAPDIYTIATATKDGAIPLNSQFIAEIKNKNGADFILKRLNYFEDLVITCENMAKALSEAGLENMAENGIALLAKINEEQLK